VSSTSKTVSTSFPVPVEADAKSREESVADFKVVLVLPMRGKAVSLEYAGVFC
jgi:hypothetical protein